MLAVLALMAVSIGAVMGRSTPPPSLEAAPAAIPPMTTGAAEALSVHVSGRVVAPGVVRVPPGSIVADAIAAAGGLRTGAAVDLLNLAAPVSQGDHVVVPGPGDAAGERAPVPGGSADTGVVSLNSATAADLETLPGVGPVLAERIVAWREQNGPFDVVEDLLEVSGIGESKLAAMRDFVTP